MRFLFCVFFNAKWNKKNNKNIPIDILLILLTSILYIVNKAVLKHIFNGVYRYFFVCYFNDLICPLFFLSYANLLLMIVKKNIKSFKDILFLIVPAGLVWEYLAPFLNPSATADVYDLLCYFAGSVLYYFFIKFVGSKR